MKGLLGHTGPFRVRLQAGEVMTDRERAGRDRIADPPQAEAGQKTPTALRSASITACDTPGAARLPVLRQAVTMK
jgi:hypothetical protein